MDIDRDALLAVLALNAGMIEPDRLASAFRERNRSSVPLAEVLVRRGDLSADRRDELLGRLEVLVSEDAGDPRSLRLATSGELIAAGRSAATLPHSDSKESPGTLARDPMGFASVTAGASGRAAAIADGPTVTAPVDSRGPSPGTAPTQVFSPSGGPPDPGRAAGGPAVYGTSRGRFRVVRPYARGGLGAVHVAFDEELRREVALKEIQDRHADDPDSRSRFLLEAEVTGGLEHPGVVPVYSLGANDDGRPFYAMRFIRGESLRRAIEHFHHPERGPRDPGGRSLQLRALLRRFVDVCNALEYAHSRGVIHRDVKPDNVMLGPYGETLVVDWGLAKGLDRVESSSRGGERPLRPRTAGGSTPTLDGSAVGTPAFMSPEQAGGDLGLQGPACDVYSLGATLYQILTGVPPFAEKSIDLVLHKVRRGEFPPPRQVKPEVPPALEAICLTAMARSIEDRYTSCRSLADDLEHWLADEPVSVYRDPLSVRAFRWAKRHRTGVAVAAALVAAGLPILAASAVLIGRERDRATAMEEMARAAVEDMYLDVAETILGDLSDPRQEDFLRRALGRLEGPLAGIDDLPEPLIGPEPPPIVAATRRPMREALAYYEGFARQGGIGPTAALDAARAHTRIGDITARLGRFDEAEAAYRRSSAMLEPIAADARAPAEARRRLAEARAGLGALLAVLGRSDEAEPLLLGAIAGRSALVDDDPTALGDALALANAQVELAELQKLSGRFAEAEASYRAAIDRLGPPADAPGADVPPRRDLAAAADGLGVLLVMLGRAEEAEPLLRRAFELQAALVAELPTVPRLREGLAKTGNSLGLLLRRDGRLVEAEAMLQGSLGHYDRLAGDFAGRVEYRRALARGRLNLGVLLLSMGKLAEAEGSFREAVDRFEALAAEAPGVLKVRRDLVRARFDLGGSLDRLGRLDEAAEQYATAVTLADGLVEQFPEPPDLRFGLASALINRGSVLDLLGDPDASERDLTRALGLLGRLVEEVPDRPAYRRELAACRAAIGLSGLHAGRVDEAEASFALAVELYEALLEAQPGERDLLLEYATCLNNRANLKTASAGPSLRRALEIYRGLDPDGGDPGPELARLLGVVRYNLGEHLVEAGLPVEGEPEYAEGARLLAVAAEGPAGTAELRHMAAVAATDFGKLLASRGAIDEARPEFERGVALASRAASEAPIARHLRALFDVHSELVDLLLASGSYLEAAEVAAGLAEAVPGQLPLRSRSALLLDRCIAAVRADRDLDPDRASALERDLGDRAVAQVRVALDAGYDPESLRRLSDQFGPLHGRGDFEALIAPTDEAGTGE